MSKAVQSEIVARENQKEVDQDLHDMQGVNKRLERDNAIKRSGERMKNIFKMATDLLNEDMRYKNNKEPSVVHDFPLSITVPIEYNGQKLEVEVTEFKLAVVITKGIRGQSVSNRVRVIVKDESTGHVIHDATVQKPHYSDNFTSAYIDHEYSNRDNNGERDDYKSRESDKHGNKEFDAQMTLDEIPELSVVEVLLKKAVETNYWAIYNLKDHS